VNTDGNEARLERIQGGIDIISERLKHQNQMQDERHQVVMGHVERLDIEDRLLGTRVGALETESSERVGQLKGLALSGRIAWLIIGAVPVGIVAALLKLLGI
jgi:hypothetical protein